MIVITPTLHLDERELVETFVRSSGPGGQNVNKVATAVQLRFDAANSPSLPAEVRQRLTRLAGRQMTTDGVLIIDARRFRSREQNRRDAVDRLVALLRRAAQRPRVRHKTRPSRSAQLRRLDTKRRRSQTKQRRREKEFE